MSAANWDPGLLEKEVEQLRREVEELRFALTRSDLVGQAKGILMAKYKLKAGGAFEMMTAAAHSTGYTLWTVAQRVVTTGALPQTYRRPER